MKSTLDESHPRRGVPSGRPSSPTCHPERNATPYLHVIPNTAQRPTYMSSRAQPSAPPTCHPERSEAEPKNLVAKAHCPPLSSRMRGPIPVTHLSSRPQRRILLTQETSAPSRPGTLPPPATPSPCTERPPTPTRRYPRRNSPIVTSKSRECAGPRWVRNRQPPRYGSA